MVQQPDKLRSHSTALNPDERTLMSGIIDRSTGKVREFTLVDQHDLIARLVLNDFVPEEIKIHFETSKNCYLYAWFVFRFYQVAEQQACITLEYALRERFPSFVAKEIEKHRFGHPPSLGSLLKHAVNEKILRNELFPSRVNWARRVAKQRYRAEIHLRAIEQGLEEYSFDDSHVHETEEDLATDWLSNFVLYLPKIRNDLAHGSKGLREDIWHTFDIVCSMINMLYPEAFCQTQKV